MNHAEKVVQKAGGVETVASELGVTINAVYAWQRNGWIPLARARALAAMTGFTPEYVARRKIP